MVRQNEVMNLTAITEPAQVAKLHLLDSLTVLCAADLTLIIKKFPGKAMYAGCDYSHNIALICGIEEK